jgi:hypothetical protein
MKQIVVFLVAYLAAGSAFAQINCNEGLEPIDSAAASPMGPLEFVQTVAVKDLAHARAFATYGYTLDLTVQTLQGDVVDGEFHQIITLGFDAAGARRATVKSELINSLSRLKFLDRDINGFADMLPFAFSPGNLADLDIVYSGRQKVGEIDASVFDAVPRASQSPFRGFQGRAWVRASDNAISKTCSRSSSFPIAPLRFDIQRAQIDGEYWFPVLLRADEDAEIGTTKVHVRVIAKYSDYQARR